MKKIVVLTGAGMSAESGLSTFRDADGLWENYPVARVATHEAWETDPDYVNDFYNMLRGKLLEAKPNRGHELVAALHEQAGSRKVIHLHGELMKVCSSRDPYNPHFIKTLAPGNLTVAHGEKAGDGSLLRPFIVFFGESVPMIEPAVEEVEKADMMIIIGTSLVVYPAAGLVRYVRPGAPIYLIDPKPSVSGSRSDIRQIVKGASAGMEELMQILEKEG